MMEVLTGRGLGRGLINRLENAPYRVCEGP